MKLKKGDTIGIFSPSVGITAYCPKRTARAKEFLEGKGFKVKMGSLYGKSDYYRSGSIEERVEELNELIRDSEVRCIMSSIGGMNSNSLLPYIDYEAFKRDPKIVIGYSDVTAILMGIYTQTGIPTYYGPAFVASFGEMEPYNELTYGYFEDILVRDRAKEYEYKVPEYWTEEFINWEDQDRSKDRRENEWICFRKGIAEGRLIIGNLNTIGGIWGSPYMPEIEKGDILFIEDSLHDIATVERSFSHLKLSGVFDKIGGLILGKHELFKDRDSGRKHYEVLLEVLGDEYDFPFLGEVDCCHTHPMFTMEIGSRIRMDSRNKSIVMIEER